MGISRNTGAGSLIVLSVIAIVYGGERIHDAREYATVAPREATTSAQVVKLHGMGPNSSLSYYRCRYSFTVEGTSYEGRGSCPTEDASKAALEMLEDSGGSVKVLNAPVYYNPDDPSLSSLTEFGAASRNGYLAGELSIGLAVPLFGFVALGAVLTETRAAKAAKSLWMAKVP